MRNIEFRGKRKDNGEWVYGCLYFFNYESNPVNPIRAFISPINKTAYADGEPVEEWEVDPGTVGQFTGLRDSKRTDEYPEGQKIYDGDISKCNNRGWTRRFEIIWIDDRAKFMFWNSSQPNISFDLTYHTVIEFRAEVIGNIYEQPDLREK